MQQEAVLSADLGDILPLTATAFWLFIGSEFIVPLGKDMKNPKRNVPLSMFFVPWDYVCDPGAHGYRLLALYSVNELGQADSPHILYAVNLLGGVGRYWRLLSLPSLRR